ncbi:helix-turn-helix domain-containing protein [Streptomyces sp. DW26H14]|uniref:helix-turn-helix domain-containing protein n=1 Tax=Streptomyces sp. DW26H14 TaxID=3435395 RepID=UPI00403DD5F8
MADAEPTAERTTAPPDEPAAGHNAARNAARHPASKTGAGTDDFAQLLVRLKAHYGVTDSEIARRIDVSPATVNHWVHRKRGTGRGPKRASLEALAREFPHFPLEEIFASVGRAVPGSVSSDEEAEVLTVYADLTAVQQEFTLIQMRALRESNLHGRA